MSNQSNHRDVVEDKPHMRSVAIHSSTPSVPPPMPMGRSVAAKPTPWRQTDARGHEKSFGLQFGNELPTNAPTGKLTETTHFRNWKVDEVKNLPPRYFLERTSIYVPNVKAQDIADRVANCLRQESIDATFFNNEAMVEAETVEHVNFSIQLWSDKGQVVVEIQRGGGCSFLFQQTARIILRAAKSANRSRSSSPVQPRGIPASFRLPDCIPQESPDETKRCIKESLDIAASMLQQDRKDQHMMALQTLKHLSCATAKCRDYAARLIMAAEGDFLATILSLIESFRMSLESSSSDERLNEMHEEHFALMHRHALAVLANCLAALSESGELSQLLASGPQDLVVCRRELLISLIEAVASSKMRPHDACDAVRCLHTLLRYEATKLTLMDMGVSEVIEVAREQGFRCHALLEDEAKKLQMQLGNHV